MLFRCFRTTCRITPAHGVCRKAIYSVGRKAMNLTMDIAALILVVIGALNWGSIGLFNVDLVGSIFGGQASVISRIIYTVVGLGGLWAITFFFRDKVTAGDRNSR